MKGVHPLVAMALVTVISVVAISLVFQMGNPAVERTKEIALLQEGKSNLIEIRNYIDNVAWEGEGSTRSLPLSISGGSYSIDTQNDMILFSMDTSAQIIGVGVSKNEDDIEIKGYLNRIYLNLSFTNFDITGGGEFGKGSHTIVIKNNGFNSTNQKQIINLMSVR